MYNSEFPTLINGLEPDLQAWAGGSEENDKHAEVYAYAEDIVIKQYESLRHCVLFIIIEEYYYYRL